MAVLWSTRILSLFCASLSVLLLLVPAATAQSTTSTGATSTATATIFPGTDKWSYYGCYNETTLSNGTNGLRALNGGTTEDLTTMTVQVCLDFCASNSYPFAGLEYTKECYCAQYISSISAKVPDSSCDLPCAANSSQICGGALKLSIYNAKKTTKGAGSKIASDAPVGSILALGIAMGVLLCLA